MRWGQPLAAAAVVASVVAADPAIPPLPASCPSLTRGARAAAVSIGGMEAKLWIGNGSAPGPVFFYWHGTSLSPEDAVGFRADDGIRTDGIGLACDGCGLSDILDSGGVIIAFVGGFFRQCPPGTDATPTGVWCTTDFLAADDLLACAVDQLNIDVRYIFTGGCSAGGLMASVMAYQRSGYLAGVITNSGGVMPWASNDTVTELQDPAHVPSVMAAYGAADGCTGGAIIDASCDEVSGWYKHKLATRDFLLGVGQPARDGGRSPPGASGAGLAALGGRAVECDHGGGHCKAPPELRRAQWEFLIAHPFGTAPAQPPAQPYPDDLPSYCTVLTADATPAPSSRGTAAPAAAADTTAPAPGWGTSPASRRARSAWGALPLLCAVAAL